MTRTQMPVERVKYVFPDMVLENDKTTIISDPLFLADLKNFSINGSKKGCARQARHIQTHVIDTPFRDHLRIMTQNIAAFFQVPPNAPLASALFKFAIHGILKRLKCRRIIGHRLGVRRCKIENMRRTSESIPEERRNGDRLSEKRERIHGEWVKEIA